MPALDENLLRNVKYGGQVRYKETHERQEGGFTFVSSQTSASLANNASLEFVVRVVTEPVHMIHRSTLGGDGFFYLYEGATFSNDGTAAPRINKNRTSENTSSTLVFTGPTVTGTGTLLESAKLAGGSGGAAEGATIGDDEEWVLAEGDYLVRLTNTAGGNQPASLFIEWYEND